MQIYTVHGIEQDFLWLIYKHYDKNFFARKANCLDSLWSAIAEKQIYVVTYKLCYHCFGLEVIEVTHRRPIQVYWQILCALESFQHCCSWYILYQNIISFMFFSVQQTLLFCIFKKHICFWIVPFAYYLMILEFVFLEHSSFSSVVRLNNTLMLTLSILCLQLAAS